MKVSHVYKVYKNGQYLGMLPKPSNDFDTSQDINTLGSDLVIVLPHTLDDLGATLVQDIVIDHLGNNIIDHNGDNIIASEYYNFSNIPINPGNEIKVFETSDYNPTSICVFNGIIQKFSTNLAENSIVVTAVSDGIKLDNIMFGQLAGSLAASNETTDSNQLLYIAGATVGQVNIVAQTFQVTVDTPLRAVSIVGHIDASVSAQAILLKIYEGTPLVPGTTIRSVVNPSVKHTTDQEIKATYVEGAVLYPGIDYTMHVEYLADSGSNLTPFSVRYNSTSVYANGQMYTYTEGTGWAALTKDLAFKIYTGDNTIGALYEATSPTKMIKDAIDNAASQGSKITYSNTSIDDTSTNVSYRFHGNTSYEVIKKSKELAPSNWYWYIDMGTNELHFHRRSQIAEHTFIIGKHIESIDLEYTIEHVRNLVYFTGGDPANSGTNILTISQNNASAFNYTQWLERASDNRAESEQQTRLLARNILDQHNAPVFSTTVVILADIYDISTIKLGQVITFNNGGDLINNLRLQISSIQRTPYYARLRLETLVPFVNERVEQLKRDLTMIETLNNPTNV